MESLIFCAVQSIFPSFWALINLDKNNKNDNLNKLIIVKISGNVDQIDKIYEKYFHVF